MTNRERILNIISDNLEEILIKSDCYLCEKYHLIKCCPCEAGVGKCPFIGTTATKEYLDEEVEE